MTSRNRTPLQKKCFFLDLGGFYYDYYGKSLKIYYNKHGPKKGKQKREYRDYMLLRKDKKFKNIP